MSRTVLITSGLGLLGGSTALVVGLSGGNEPLALGGGIAAAASVSGLLSSIAVASFTSAERTQSLERGRAVILKSQEAGPWVNDKPAIAMELRVTVDGATTTVDVKERLPNFHLQAGLLQPGVELPVAVDRSEQEWLVEVLWDRWDDERTRAALGEATDADRDPTRGLPNRPPAIGAHVVDGTRPPVRALKLAITLAICAVPLVAGVVLWASGQVVVGILLAMLGTTLTTFMAGTVVVARRQGMIWSTSEAPSWPGQTHPAEVIEVWELGRVGFGQVHGFWLRVHAPSGAWEVQTRQSVPDRWVGALGPGLKVTVRAEADAPQRVPIDWEASSPPN